MPVLAARGGKSLVQSVLVPAGQRAQFVVKLKRGTYELYCSLLDHQALGMDTTLIVKAPKRGS